MSLQSKNVRPSGAAFRFMVGKRNDGVTQTDLASARWQRTASRGAWMIKAASVRVLLLVMVSLALIIH